MALVQQNKKTARTFRQRIKWAALVIATGMASYNLVNACELHAGMDGMPGMGFGFQHPLMQQHMMQSSPAVIDIRIAKSYRVTHLEQTSVVLRYSAPSQFHSLSLEVTGSEGVDIKRVENGNLGRLVGREDIVFTAKEPGTHTVTLRINAIKDDKPVSYRRVVTVNAV